VTIILVEPLLILIVLIVVFVVWPPIAPYIVWIPYVGAALRGQAALNAQSKGSAEVLTRRLEKVLYYTGALDSRDTWYLVSYVGLLRTGGPSASGRRSGYDFT